MVNMFSMGSMMNGSNTNMYQYYRERYGCGYEDFGHRPYYQGYPMAVSHGGHNSPLDQNWLTRFIKRIFT